MYVRKGLVVVGSVRAAQEEKSEIRLPDQLQSTPSVKSPVDFIIADPMKRIVALLLLAVVNFSYAGTAHARDRNNSRYTQQSRAARKAAKKQQKAAMKYSKNYSKQQQKLMKKQAKAQRKALKQARKRSHR